jgi:uncharacterized protein (DUF58 family)
MRLPFIPGRRLLLLLGMSAALALGALVAGVSIGAVMVATWLWLLAVAGFATFDLWRSRKLWRAAPARLTRRLPPALAIGVRRQVGIALEHTGNCTWQVQIHDHVDSSLQTEGLPAALQLLPGKRSEIAYQVTPGNRGEYTFQPAELRLRSRLGLWELLTTVGDEQIIRVYPDFAQVARYAWLAGDRRLQEIGIKNTQRRGSGTDFRQLAEYRRGDPVRHIDWKATQRQQKVIVRQFQEDRDQCVWLLIDCGRRMRADDRSASVGSSHFDQVLNAVMLMSYVALREGDSVGASTFGTPLHLRKAIAPRKGVHAMGGLMSQIYDAQPCTSQPDYLAAAQDFLRRQPKRSLVVIITNFRDEDCVELAHALRLLRARHLVLVASLRERVVGDLMEQPATNAAAALDIASAHLHAQARQDAFARLALRDSLLVDAEPESLGVELVNRYHAAKLAGMI